MSVFSAEKKKEGSVGFVSSILGRRKKAKKCVATMVWSPRTTIETRIPRFGLDHVSQMTARLELRALSSSVRNGKCTGF
ncbi:MAG: hypothetical protein V1857_05135 [archaeon]